MHVRLLITGFAPPPATGARHPAFGKLLVRGRRTHTSWTSLDRWLLEGFGIDTDGSLPSAPFALRGDGGDPGDAYWVHADPVHLAAGNTQVGVTGARALALGREEAEGFAEVINTHFSGVLQVFPLRPDRWYARIESPPAGSPAPLAEVLARGIELGAATDDSLGWHSLMNELQMLLFEHPLNIAREARGALPVNGVWLWGGGRESKVEGRPLRSVFAESPLATGLAATSGARHAAPPAGAQPMLDQTADGVTLVIHEHADADALELDWMQPLTVALRRERIGMLTIHLVTGDELLSVENTRGDLRRFWRRPRPIAAWMPRNEPDETR